MATIGFDKLTVIIGADLKEFQDGLAKVSGNLDQFAKDTKQYMQGMGIALSAAGAAMTATLGLAIKEAASFEQAVANVAVLTGKTGDAFTGAKKQIADMAIELNNMTQYTENEATNAMRVLLQKGIDPTKAGLTGLSTAMNLARATGADLTSTTAGVVQAMRAYNIAQDDMAKVADMFAKAATISGATMEEMQGALQMIAPVARTANMNLEETVAVLGKVAQQGVPMRMATMGIRLAMTELINPTDKMREILNQLRLTTDDVSLKTNDFATVLGNLDKAGISSAQVLEMFGTRSGAVINALLAMDSSGQKAYLSIGNLTEQLKNSSGTAKQMADETLNTLNGQILIFQNAVGNLSRVLGQALVPSMTELMKNLSTGVSLLTEFASAHPEVVENVTKTAAAIGILSLSIGALQLALSPFAGVVSAFIKGMAGITAAVQATLIAGQAIQQTTTALVVYSESLAAVQKACMAAQASQAAMAAGATVLSGILTAGVVIAVAAAAYAVTRYVMDLWEAVKVERAMQEASENTAKTMQERNRIAYEGAQKLIDTYHDLSVEDMSTILALEGRVRKMRELAEAWGDEKKWTIEQQQIYLQGTLAIAEQYKATEELIKQKGYKTEAEIKEAEAASRKLQIVKETTESEIQMIRNLRELNVQLADGTLKAGEYSERFNEIRDSAIGVVGSADEVLKKMQEFNQTDTTVKIRFEVEGREQLMSTAERIRQLQEEQILEGLEGAKRQAVQEKFDAENRILVTQKTIQAEANMFEQYVAQRTAAAETEKKQKAENYNLNMKAQADEYNMIVNQIDKRRDMDIEAHKKVTEQGIKGYQLELTEFLKLHGAKMAALEKEGGAIDAVTKRALDAFTASITAIYAQLGLAAPAFEAVSNLEQTARSYSTGYSTGGGGGVSPVLASYEAGYTPTVQNTVVKNIGGLTPYVSQPAGTTAAGTLTTTSPSYTLSPVLISMEKSLATAVQQVTGGLQQVAGAAMKSAITQKVYSDFAATYTSRMLSTGRMSASDVLGTTYGQSSQGMGTVLNYMAGSNFSPGAMYSSGGGSAPTVMTTMSAWQTGTPYVPRTGLALLHKGEAIIPAEQNRVGGRGGGAQAGGGTVIINVFQESLVPAIMAKYPNAIINPVLTSMLKNPTTQRIIKAAVRR